MLVLIGGGFHVVRFVDGYSDDVGLLMLNLVLIAQ